jgi:hypothetical protein
MRRLAMLLLVVGVIFTGLTACPMAGLCCFTQPQETAAHDCCKKGTATIRTSDCCRDAQLGYRAVNSQAQIHGLFVLVLTGIAAGDCPEVATITLASALRNGSTHGPAPPATLTAQHTSLLL